MSLETKREENVVTRLASTVELPRMARYRQIFDESHIPGGEIADAVMEEIAGSGLAGQIRQGMTIAITGGSRGVANISLVLKAIVDYCKGKGAKPFVFPAMGSHGGAMAEGQLEILSGYGITEEFLGCPIRATMETVYLGDTEEGMRIYGDKYAAEADGIILCNRIKAHTAFRGPYESGLIKMAVIGMGKQHGAEQVHQNGFSELGRLLPMIGRVVMEKTPVIGGIGLVENAFDETCLVRAMTADEIWEEEPKLLEYSKKRMGKIYLNDIDVLVVDRIGKDCSGDGMDPNITGRFAVDYIKGDLRVQHIAVLDLTEETHGNCNGLGLADVTTKRLVDKINVDETFPNVVTSTVLCTPKIPLFTHTDKACIQIALRTCNYIDRERPRIVRIKDTMHISEIWVSEAMLEEAGSNGNLELIEAPEDWNFNEFDNLWT